MINRLVILPARSGSKRIPNKNIKDFCGKPIIEYPINSISKSKIHAEIHISTDSFEISKLAGQLGYEPLFLRPKELADDNTGLISVLQFVVSEYRDKLQRKFDQIWLLMPCNPFLTEEYILAADLMARKYPDECIMSVCEYAAPIEWAYKIGEEGLLTPCNRNFLKIRSQDIHKKYHHNGMIAIFPAKKFYQSGLRLDLSYRGIIMPKDASIDIDDEEDWRLAEMIFKAKQNKSK